MYPVSARFRVAISRPHRMVAYADLLTPNGTARVALIDGSISLDRTAQVRAQGDLTFAVDDLPATIRTALRTPYAVRAQVWRGVRFADGAEEVVPLARLWLTENTWDRQDKVILKCKGFDRASVITDAKFPDVRTISSASTLGLISDLEREVFAATWNGPVARNLTNLTVLPGVVDAAVPSAEITGDDRWGLVQGLAASIEAEVYAAYDSDGLVVAPFIDPYAYTNVANAVWTIRGGEDTGVLVEYEGTRSRSDVYNAVQVVGKAVGGFAAPTYYLEDTRPTSPTYVRTFGRRTLVITSEAFTTLAQCQNAARQALQANVGVSNALTLKTAPNPALRPGDFVGVDLYDLGAEPHLVDTVSIPLTPAGDFTLTTRSTTLPPPL